MAALPALPRPVFKNHSYLTWTNIRIDLPAGDLTSDTDTDTDVIAAQADKVKIYVSSRTQFLCDWEYNSGTVTFIFSN